MYGGGTRETEEQRTKEAGERERERERSEPGDREE
jgi:hypothetical protein